MLKDFRFLVGAALFVQTSVLFVIIALKPTLTESQGFMALATAVIVTGWVGGAAAFAFTSGVEASRNNTSLNKALDLAQIKVPLMENGHEDQSRETDRSDCQDGERAS